MEAVPEAEVGDLSRNDGQCIQRSTGFVERCLLARNGSPQTLRGA